MAGRIPDHRVKVAVHLRRWEDITFLHWPIDVAALQPLVAPGLEIDTFDGMAWLTITPLLMKDLRLPGLPIPVVRRFVEVNVRTYVRGPDGRDGVWFFSLECPRLPVVGAARAAGVPYVWARTANRRQRQVVEYASRRRRGSGTLSLRVHAGEPVPPYDALSNFLTGRWNAYFFRLGRLWRVPIEHEPWPLFEARTESYRSDLLAVNGLPTPAISPLTHVSAPVNVRFGLPRPA